MNENNAAASTATAPFTGMPDDARTILIAKTTASVPKNPHTAHRIVVPGDLLIATATIISTSGAASIKNLSLSFVN